MIVSPKALLRFRILFICAFAALSSACGFTPMHAPSNGFGGGEGAFGNVSVALGSDIRVDDKEAAFWVQQRLAERLGTQTGAAQILEITPSARRGGVGISGQDIATRYDLNLALKYKLIDAASGKVLDKGTLNAVSTFTATNDPYALIAAEKETVKQLASDTADRLLTRVAGYYASTR
jgi:hypothetical protein